MNKIIMNEQDYISELREKGNLGSDIGYAVSILTKSFRGQGDDIDTIRHKLEADLRKNEPRLESDRRDLFISNALSCVDKRKLNVVNEIAVTKAEMDSIMSITSCEGDFRSSTLRRPTLTLLCFGRPQSKRVGVVNIFLRYSAARIAAVTAA